MDRFRISLCSEKSRQMFTDLLQRQARKRALHYKNVVEWYKTFFANWEPATRNERQKMQESYPDFVTEPDLQKFMTAYKNSGMVGVQDECSNFVRTKLKEEGTLEKPLLDCPPDMCEFSFPIYREALLEEYRRLTDNA